LLTDKQTNDENITYFAEVTTCGKLTPTHSAWSATEKEVYAAVCALKRFKNWMFEKSITLSY